MHASLVDIAYVPTKKLKSRWCRLVILVINPNRKTGINVMLQKGIQVAMPCAEAKNHLFFLKLECWSLVGLTKSRLLQKEI